VVEYLPSELEALNSNPCTGGKKQKKDVLKRPWPMTSVPLE
jgi:hypothetical protein